jgi:predicted porin
MLHKGRFALKAVAGVAALLFAGAACAQSSVTLYGILDTGVLYTSRTVGAIAGQNAGKNFSLINGGLTPSIFGLTGTEDLGGGVKLSFKLESGFSPGRL